MLSQELFPIIIKTANDIKAFDITVYKMANISAEMDYNVICSGNSTAHIQGISEKVEIKLKQSYNIYPYGIEGKRDSDWILIDYQSIVVHIMVENKRELLEIDQLYKQLKSEQIDISKYISL